MGLLAWMLVGLISGWLTREITRRHGLGLVNNILFGLIGAFAGGFLTADLLAVPDLMTSINLTTVVVSLVGALIVLLIAQTFRESHAAA